MITILEVEGNVPPYSFQYHLACRIVLDLLSKQIRGKLSEKNFMCCTWFTVLSTRIIVHQVLIISAKVVSKQCLPQLPSSQAAQAQNTRSYIVFFLLSCELSAKRDL